VNVDHETLLMIFVGVTGAAVLLQAIVLFALYLSVSKSSKAMQAKIDELQTVVVPVLNQSREFLTRVGPKIDAAAGDLAEITRSLRAQSEDLQRTTTEVLEKTRRQSERIDIILSKVRDGVDSASTAVASAVTKPVKQMQAVMAGAKAVIGVLISGAPRQAQTHVAADKDMFV
jgi:hypothetical protein